MLQYVFATSRFAVATDEPLKPGPQVPFFTPRQFVLGNPMFQSVPGERTQSPGLSEHSPVPLGLAGDASRKHTGAASAQDAFIGLLYSIPILHSLYWSFIYGEGLWVDVEAHIAST